MCMLDKCVDDRLGVFALYSGQHHVARVPFHQCRDLTVVAADYEIAFPVAGQCSVFNRGGPFADRDSIADLPQAVSLETFVARATHGSCLSKVL